MASQVYVDSITLSSATEFNRFDTAAYCYLTGVAGTNTITAGGPANAVLTTPQHPFILVPAVTNTGATTLNITPSGGAALGAKSVFAYGAACVGGELVAGVPAWVVYDGTQYNILNPQPISGTFTATLTGCTTAPTYTVKWVKIRNLVVLTFPNAAWSATSNATGKTFTGMPSHLFPADVVWAVALAADNGGAQVVAPISIAATGVITMAANGAGGTWTASGSASGTMPMMAYTVA